MNYLLTEHFKKEGLEEHPWIDIVFKNLNTLSKHCTEHNQGLLHLANDETASAWPEIGTYCHIHPHPPVLGSDLCAGAVRPLGSLNRLCVYIR